MERSAFFISSPMILHFRECGKREQGESVGIGFAIFSDLVHSSEFV
jgi:hypothetical protein